jgi:hypothetical protein
MTVLLRCFLVVGLAPLLAVLPAPAGSGADQNIPRLVILHFHSTTFANDRLIRVLLPPGYSESDSDDLYT